jgi:hypothetical protein
VSKKFGCKSMDGLIVYRVVHVGSVGTPPMITDDTETF